MNVSGVLRTVLAVAVLGLSTMALAADDGGREARLADFDAFCRFVADDYAYFDVKETDWPAVCAAGRPMAATAEGRAAFIGVVEHALAELYDPHAHLGASTTASWRLVPTDSDAFATWRDGAATIVDVRRDSAGAAAGLRRGLRVVAVDEHDIDAAVHAVAPAHLLADDPAARDWALNVVLAGHQDRQPVRLVVEDAGVRKTIDFVPRLGRPAALVSSVRIDEVGVITIHNALGDPAAVAAFDAALDSLAGVSALVLDLRDTPSGGNTAVARGVMGRLVAHEAPYQRHERISEARESGVRRVWVEYVEPRGASFDRPIVVLVGHWTGSMGEGIAIGLDAARGATVVGTPMAGLRGALDELKLPNAGFVVRIPAEKLFHVDGTPRESFVPRALPQGRSGLGDDDLQAAVQVAAAFAVTAGTGVASTKDAASAP